VARPGRWAALSAAAPLLVLVIAYWRLQKFDVDIAWTLTALVLSAIELGAASWVAQRRNEPPETPRDREIEIALAAMRSACSAARSPPPPWRSARPG
jgi:hypothetical protein